VFEAANPEPHSKHANHYATENEDLIQALRQLLTTRNVNCAWYDYYDRYILKDVLAKGTSYYGEPGSSVSIVSGYGLDDRAIEVRSSAETKGFLLYPLCPDRLWSPAFCRMGTGGSFSGAKARPGREADHSPPSSAEIENE
jgi:hypothetical protein